MANQLGKFTPNLAELTQPLRELLSKKNAWTWGPTQEEVFKQVKLELTRPTTLAIYNPEVPTKIGAVLLQQSSTQWKPVAYASWALSETEQRYSQIEKEALAIAWACERFAEYVIGKHIGLETDHKPLVPLLSKKDLAHLPPQILRFRLRLTRFSYNISHVPGKLLCTADTLSRAPVSHTVDKREDMEMESFVQAIISSLPAGQDRLSEYRQAQLAVVICSQVISYCKEGWPDQEEVSSEVTVYWTVRTELTVVDNLLLYRNRIVVPKSLQTETLRKIHQGHQGIVKCRERVASAVWWPGVSTQLEEFVKACPICLKTAVLPKEPLLQTPLPSRPWERIAADLCELKGSDYLVVIDYYSRYIEVQKLTTTTSLSVIAALKGMFSRHGIPSVLVSDNGPQLVSQEMKEFATSWKFQQVTSSPYYPQSNGLAERAVKTVKSLLGNSTDPYMALLSYHATHFHGVTLVWQSY